MKEQSFEQSSPQFELNALAPLRIAGLARKIIKANAGQNAEIDRLANELLDLQPHIIEMLCSEADKLEEEAGESVQ